MGPVGTGKTTLAMLVSKAAIKAGRSVAIYSLPRLLNEIRDTHRSERSHVELLDRLTAVDLLHIDDVGAERTTDWVLEELYSIVNARYEDRAVDGDHDESSTTTSCARRSPPARPRGWRRCATSCR